METGGTALGSVTAAQYTLRRCMARSSVSERRRKGPTISYHEDVALYTGDPTAFDDRATSPMRTGTT